MLNSYVNRHGLRTSTKDIFDDFDAIFSGFNLDGVFKNSQFYASKVETTETEATITLQVPGHNSTSLEIEATASVLSVKSVRDALPKGASTVDKTWKFGADRYDSTAVSAECKDGILTIVVPRKKEAEKKSKKVIIK